MATLIKYDKVNDIEYSISIFDRPEMELPVYRLVIPVRASISFLQRIETNSYTEWHLVKKTDGVWTSVKFLGFSKQEAINTLI
jgi:hypothetical protein